MRAALFLVLLLPACGSRVIIEYDPGADGGTSADSNGFDSITPIDSEPLDTSIVDTSIEDTIVVIDDGPFVCDEPVTGFSCPPVKMAVGSKACDDKSIRAVIDACFGDSATSASCSSAQKKYGMCASCMLSTFITEGGFIDIAPCIRKVSPASKCADSINCAYACWSEACASCDFSGGAESEYNQCLSRQSEPTGSCWSYGAKDYTDCISDPSLSVCIPQTTEDLLPFYRGGCRDGADWSKVNTPDGT